MRRALRSTWQAKAEAVLHDEAWWHCLDNLADAGRLSRSHFLADIEFGVESIQGSGTLRKGALVVGTNAYGAAATGTVFARRQYCPARVRNLFIRGVSIYHEADVVGAIRLTGAHGILGGLENPKREAVIQLINEHGSIYQMLPLESQVILEHLVLYAQVAHELKLAKSQLDPRALV